MSDPGTLHSVEVAVGENTSLKKMTIQTSNNVAVAILKGAAKNETLGTLKLVTQGKPAPELVDEVRRLNPKLQLTVEAGRRESEHVQLGCLLYELRACTVYLMGLSKAV